MRPSVGLAISALLFAIIAFSSSAIASEEEIKGTINDYTEFFNAGDLNGLDALWDSPIAVIMAGQNFVFESYSASGAYEGAKGTDWSYSTLNSTDLIYEDGDTAMVDVNFSRFNKNDELISIFSVVYLLVRKSDMWKLKAGFAPVATPLATDR